jgi:arylsulfatase A-like enzyme
MTWRLAGALLLALLIACHGDPAAPPPSPFAIVPAVPLPVVVAKTAPAKAPIIAPRHVALMKEGATAKLAETIRESDTLPSHASMLSGVSADSHGLWWNSYHAERGYIQVPTIFSVAHAAGLTTAMIVGKPKLRHIAIPGTVDHFERPSYLCGGVSKRAAEYFVQAKPDLLFVHFSDPDEYGHSHGWMSPEYLKGVENSDKCLATVLAAIDSTDMAASTLVIVTADHGGHGFRHSDGHDSVDRDIPWIVRGPQITPGSALDGTVETVDTAATTLAALGLPALPHMLGAARFTFVR